MISLRLVDNEYPFDGFDHTRLIARGIVLNDEGKVALHVVHRDDAFCNQTYYETPGGGVDEGESFAEAFERECMEELGAKVQILAVLGEIEDAYNLIHRKNINRFYLAKLVQSGKPHFASKGDNYIQKTEWLGLEDAIARMEKQDDTLVAGLVKRRELPILQEVRRLRDAHKISWSNGPLHRGTKRLETPRLLLRRFEDIDAEMMFANWAGDKDATEFLEWPAHANVDVTKSVISVWCSKYGDPTFYQWIIEEKEIKEPIGSISVIHSDFDAFEIGFVIAKSHWDQGYATEALEAVKKYLFEEVGVSLLWAKHDVDNPRAGRVMAKAGFRFKEMRPHGGFDQRGVCDVDVYEMTKSEYAALKGR